MKELLIVASLSIALKKEEDSFAFYKNAENTVQFKPLKSLFRDLAKQEIKHKNILVKEMKKIVNIADSVGAWILSDEVYRGAELDGDISPSFWGMYDKTLVVSGLSKAFTMPGLRMGWLVGPKEIIADSWTYTDYTTITTGAINAWLAERALRPETQQKIRQRNRDIASKNLKVLTDWIESHPEILRFVPPKINGVTFIGYNLNISSTDLVMKLLQDKSVLIAPGEFCGLDGYVRIGYGMKNLAEGLSRISETLKELKATL